MMIYMYVKAMIVNKTIIKALSSKPIAWYTLFLFYTLFFSNNPLRKGFEKLLEKVQLCSRVWPRNDQFHVRGSVYERQFRIQQKEYWRKPSDKSTNGWTPC